ncbi:NAD-dependent protein deacetylase sirtuin-2, partial [Cladochytrium tenue]
RKPEPFFQLARELFPGQFVPTLSHVFIRVLADEGLLLRCYTQNIDTLERAAGVPADLIVEAHGSFHSATCIGRGYTHDPDVERSLFPHLYPGGGLDDVDSDEDVGGGTGRNVWASPRPKLKVPPTQGGPTEPAVFEPGCGHRHKLAWVREQLSRGRVPPVCERCGRGVVKPDITFFGESLPRRFLELCDADLRAADALLVLGTSLSVQPFASLLGRVRPRVPRLLVNREVVAAASSLRGGGGAASFDFDGSVHEYRRDALFLGACDDGCRELARALGLEAKLDEAMAEVRRAHARASSGTPVTPAKESRRAAASMFDEQPSSPVGTTPLDSILGDLKI